MDSRRTTPLLYDEHRNEKAERRGTGFLGFLSDLDWMLSLELEEGRPLDDSKITTAQKFFSFNQGFKFGIGVHSAVLFMMSLALYSLLWSFKIENPILIHAIFFGNVFFSLLVKIAIPLWLIEDYYVFPKGITYTYLSWFMVGYSIGIFVPEFVYVMVVALFMGVHWILQDSLTADWFVKVNKIITKYFSHYTDWRWLPFHIFMLFLSFSPYWLLKWWKKRNPLKSYEWMPLDFIPKDDQK